MANNILKAIKNAGDAFLDTFNSKSQIDDGCVTNPQQAEQDDDSILSNKMTSSKEDDNVNSHAEFEEIKPSEEDDVIP